MPNGCLVVFRRELAALEMCMFEDLMTANAAYAETFGLRGIPARVRRGLAVLTCMDSRIEPLSMLGLVPGDAKIARNAGARVTDDVLRTLILATNFLGVDRICVVQHTDCRMTQSTQSQIEAAIRESTGQDPSGWDFLAIANQDEVLNADVERVRSCGLLAPGVTVGGFVYDVGTGLLRSVTD